VPAARGTPGNPATREDIEDKFRRLATAALPAERVAGLVEVLRRLRDVPDVARIGALASP
jgi:2-methylcitrate dehydratase PrpD